MKQASNILTLLCVGSLIAFAAFRWATPAPEGASSVSTNTSTEAETSGRTPSGVAARREPDGGDVISASLTAPRPVVRPSYTASPMICDDARLVGRRLDALTHEDDERCGLENPVEVSVVAGVEVAPPVVTGCNIATALADWLEHDVADHADTMLDASVTRIDQVSGYVCRNRNSAAKGRLSLHAVANAIDIASFHLADGAKVTVEHGWPAKDAQSEFLKASWQSACGRFGTVLGPESDEWHRDHFHLDGAERRSSYCR